MTSTMMAVQPYAWGVDALASNMLRVLALALCFKIHPRCQGAMYARMSQAPSMAICVPSG
jgi:hypothetical protein